MSKRKNDIESICVVREVKVLEVILNSGDGTTESPCRFVYQYWTKDGRLIAEKDVLEINQMWDPVARASFD